MRIWKLDDLGDPIDQLRLVDEPSPVPGPGQLLVDVEAVGLAFPDVLKCQGEYQQRTGPGFTPGGELAGTVIATGDGTDVEVGQRVVALTLAGGGGLAEQAVVPAESAFVLPDAVSAAKAAAIPINYGTSYHALYDRARLEPGETLLITGAAGGTGTSAIQLAKHIGARVIAVVGGADKVKIVRGLGADEVIDHRATPDWVDVVRELSDGGVDVAYDPVGGDTFHQVRRCMAWDGRLLVVGFVAGIPEFATNHILLKSYQLVGVHWGAAIERDPDLLGREMRELVNLAAQGVVDPPLFTDFGFDEAAAALQALYERRTHSKTVVTR